MPANRLRCKSLCHLLLYKPCRDRNLQQESKRSLLRGDVIWTRAVAVEVLWRTQRLGRRLVGAYSIQPWWWRRWHALRALLPARST